MFNPYYGLAVISILVAFNGWGARAELLRKAVADPDNEAYHAARQLYERDPKLLEIAITLALATQFVLRWALFLLMFIGGWEVLGLWLGWS